MSKGAFTFLVFVLLVGFAPVAGATPSLGEPDPLAVSKDVLEKIGSDGVDLPIKIDSQAQTTRRYFPTYEETTDGVRLRLLPPFYLERTTGLRSSKPEDWDIERFIALLFYQRRSRDVDADILFPIPLAWRYREHSSHAWGALLFGYRGAPRAWDQWFAPLYFVGARKNGGYVHVPLLLTSSQWSERSAFTLAGPYFRHRKEQTTHLGLVPLFFHGERDLHSGTGSSYTLVPPALFYHQKTEADDRRLTVAGPVVVQSTPKRTVVDVLPLFYHISGKPESGGIDESHTTVFPLVHYGRSKNEDGERSLFVVPGYVRRKTPDVDALVTPVVSRIRRGKGATELWLAGPVIPLAFDYRDRDVGLHRFGLAPLFYTSAGPTHRDWLTPFVGRFESYGESRTWWFFPTVVHSTSRSGWETDVHPFAYFGRNGTSEHAVVAPIYWDFKSDAGRTTIGFPLYWRFADRAEGKVTQVIGNTVYHAQRVAGGLDWQFHFAPLFSYGEDPNGYFWNVLFGLAGYSRHGASSQVRALWIPFDAGR